MLTFLKSLIAPGPPGPPRILLKAGIFRGKSFPVTSTPLTIGSDPEAAVSLADTLVSKRHAEIFADGKDAWVQDLESTNGTKLNTYDIPKGGKFKLNHRDRVYVAHYTMVYDDGSGFSRERYIWMGGAAVAVLVLLSMLMYRMSHPPANVLLHEANELARAGLFDEARTCLGKAGNARRADVYRLEAQALGARLDAWISTRGTWAKAMEALAAGDWTAATNALTNLNLADESAWNWNSAGAAAMADAGRAKNLLDAYLGLGNGSQPVEKLQTLLDGLPGDPPIHLARLIQESRRLIGFSQRYVFLDKLNAWPPALGEVAGFLEKARASESVTAARQVEGMIEAVKSLADSMARYQSAARLLQELKVAEALAVDSKLPAFKAGVGDHRIMAAREAIDTHFKVLVNAARLVRDAAPAEPVAGALPWEMDAWKKDGKLDSVLRCDTLSKDRPTKERSQPAGEYDRVLGAEAFFSFCMDVAERTQLSPLKTPFQPLVAATRTASAGIRNALAFADQHTDESWQGGALSEKLAGWRTDMKRLDDFARELTALAGRSEGRPALIAAGLAFQLAGQPEQLTIRDQPLKTWLATEFKKTQERTQALGEEYDKAAADRKEAITREVLDQGLPFDPVVMRLWDAAVGAELLARAPEKPPKVEPPKVEPPKVEPVKPEPPKIVNPVVQPVPPVKPPDPNAGKRAELLKRADAADTPEELGAVVEQLEKWEAASVRPDPKDVAAVGKAIKERALALCNPEFKQAKKFYEALELDKGDERFKVIIKVAQACKEHGKDEMVALARDLNVQRVSAKAKIEKRQAEQEAREKAQQEAQLKAQQEARLQAQKEPPKEVPKEVVKEPVKEPPVTKPTPEPVTPTPVAPTAMGSLVIVTVPSEAQVFVDEKLVDNKVVAVDPNINHKVRIECPGYKSHEQSYRVQPGKKRTLEILLQKEEKKGLFGW